MHNLTICNLTKSFGKHTVLNTISITCNTGEIIGIFGRNGSGKSTMLKCLFGTLKADSLQIRIDEENILPQEVITDKRIGYLPQNSFLPKEKTVRQIIPLLFPNGAQQDRIFYSEGIYKIENRKIGKLSLGELRYLEVLLLAHLDHQFLLLDEPFSMIQPIYKDQIKELLLSLKEKKGIFITDHYYDDVLGITDYNILIKNGDAVVITNKSDLKEHGYLTSTIN
ncbi:ATP-binding cassette domain-containing protein [Aquimarina sp. 2201CG5-10]|uniref:ATP-binding cassette domain-containing protein n=1 Tax=Aquimarina callyspongiae TaxID=3098150 RepID=UPI002AB421F5|nr:ATP-binding cassette domain-containing protein [Aquimarina sp. 2201CG5-10]MDY8135245.1 ATP-binding cassette domain-containing protein [Aquimarina sp. 2201CG5-10]